MNPNDDIDDLKKAVKIKCENSLSAIDSAQLRVCPPGTQVPVSEGADDPTLDPGGPVVHLMNWGTSSQNAFVIVAPDIRTYFDLMEYLLFYCRSQLLILTYQFVSFIPYKYSLLLKRPRNDETPETK